MCYDIKTNLEAQLQRARRYGDLNAVRELAYKLIPYTDLPLFHVSGFKHPKLLVYTVDSPHLPVISRWGLVPHWIKDNNERFKIWNNTLNARGETIFEKPAFREASKRNRCLIFVDGFYEHHHKAGDTFPHFIYRCDMQPMALAGLWSEWLDKLTGELMHTFTIVTTTGNALMARIHNNPKLEGPRMPVILPEHLEDVWLQSSSQEADLIKLRELIRPFPDELLAAHPVARLRGKNYSGNAEGISDKVSYPELEL